eukprot:CAMPEP_0175163856 /NCGR_PEP_ID=MMETSP0087-20121206/26027_1 /TAXON_ID=136419 /ORGANISM="Unknown Unknown, Strain D1" /LENGTH=154 /DNA_ID=CAMNT_0016452697 /DNA_START=1 /DNA_END=465 /DNA_ORIENTATION=-
MEENLAKIWDSFASEKTGTLSRQDMEQLLKYACLDMKVFVSRLAKELAVAYRSDVCTPVNHNHLSSKFWTRELTAPIQKILLRLPEFTEKLLTAMANADKHTSPPQNIKRSVFIMTFTSSLEQVLKECRFDADAFERYANGFPEEKKHSKERNK